MGVLNITGDSFYDGGLYNEPDKALSRTGEMLMQGADIIDIGAVSTRPGAAPVSAGEERDKLLPVLKKILKKYPETIISIDTFRAEIAREAVEAGASMINDISGGSIDERMFETIASLNVPYILMHMQGTPENMQSDPQYEDVTKEVLRWLADRVHLLRRAGVNDIIIDPGFGFGKTTEHNYTLMNQLEFFSIFQLPLLVGISRKSMIHKALKISPQDSLAGTIALNYQSLLKGASILRAHDVPEAVQTVGIFNLMKKNSEAQTRSIC